MSKQTTFEDAIKGTEFEGKTVEQVKNALYSQAMQDLRDAHSEEFVGLVTESYAKFGLEYKRRLTEAEKAEQKIAALLAEHPSLAAKFTQHEDEPNTVAV